MVDLTEAERLLLRPYLRLKKAFPILSLSGYPATLLFGIVLALCIRLYLKRKTRNQLIAKIPGCNVNWVFLFLAIARSVLYKNNIKSNILSFQILCGSTQLFYKDKIWRLWLGMKPVVIFFKPETVEVILNSNTILKKTFNYDFLKYWFKEGLITSGAKKWRTRRKLLTPAFHFRILSEFQPVIDEQARILCDILEKKSKIGKAFDVVKPVTLCTLDILCETAMGIKVEAQIRNSEYISALKFASEQFCDRIMKPWIWPDVIYYLTEDGKKFKYSVDTMLNFTTKVIRKRKEEMLQKLNAEKLSSSDREDEDECNFKKKAFLDLLLDHHLSDESFTENDIREEVDTFMFAGHDTTAMGISWALYAIGLYPEVQQVIHQEIDRILGDDKDRPINRQDVREMKYLERVLKESQRLFPSLPVIGRELEEDVAVNGYVVPKGTTCMLATYVLHRNPEVFPDPEVFDPDRFLPENILGRHPFAYVPFSAGPRNCIGQRFAMLEELTVVANVLRHFQIESLEQRDQLCLTAEMVLRNDTGLKMKFRKRK